jgi:hypothetical protein
MATTSSDLPLPESGRFVDAVRTSTKDLRESSGIKARVLDESFLRVALASPTDSIRAERAEQINPQGVDEFLARLSRNDFERLSVEHGLRFPLQFPSADTELNVISYVSITTNRFTNLLTLAISSVSSSREKHIGSSQFPFGLPTTSPRARRSGSMANDPLHDHERLHLL